MKYRADEVLANEVLVNEVLGQLIIGLIRNCADEVLG
jgi:hypothetical protein